MEAYLADGLWLTLARHANTMADRLAEGLARAGHQPVWPVEANELFVMLPRAVSERLKAKGASFYPWVTDSLPAGIATTGDSGLFRLVASFATTALEVDAFLATVRGS
jgi:threonine aldolase